MILLDLYYLNSLPLERGPFPSINNWHFITYPPHHSRLWCGLCSFICVLISRQIGALSKGFLVGQSAHGHRILLQFGQAVYHVSARPTSYSVHPVWALIWVKYSQSIALLFKWHHLKWKGKMCSLKGGSSERNRANFFFYIICYVSCSSWKWQWVMISSITLIMLRWRCLSSSE